MHVVGWITLVGLMAALFFLGPKKRICLTAIAVFFPVYIHASGYYLVTTGTASIFASFLLNLFSKNSRSGYRFFVGALCFIGFFATFLSLGDVDKGDAVRKYIQFCAAMTVFLSIFDLSFGSEVEKVELVNTILSIVITCIVIHVLISILILWNPKVESYIQIFFRTEDAVGITERVEGGALRLRSFVFRQESYGEIIAALCPILVYKIVARRAIWFVPLFIAFAVGVALSITRSGIVLFCVGTMITAVWLGVRNRLMFLLFVVLGLGGVAIIMWQETEIVEHALFRFGMQHESTLFVKHGLLKELYPLFLKINRGFWVDVLDKYILNPTLFGNGLVTPYNFHNLPFTVVYQIGIVGAVIYFGLVGKVFLRLAGKYFINNGLSRNLVVAGIVCLTLLFINEMKYEYTRDESYQEICFIVLGAMALLGSSEKNKRGSSIR